MNPYVNQAPYPPYRPAYPQQSPSYAPSSYPGYQNPPPPSYTSVLNPPPSQPQTTSVSHPPLSASPSHIPSRPSAVSIPSVKPQEEIKLWANSRERAVYDDLADLFSIIQTVEYLEKAYVRDHITAEQYTPACEKLLAQFRTLRDSLRDKVPDIEKFMRDNNLQAPAAKVRLLDDGVPATVAHGGAVKDSDRQLSVYVAEAVQYFITVMDSLKLNMTAVDQLHPLLNDLMCSLNKISTLPPDFEGKEKVKKWLSILNSMSASAELNEEQVRQCSFDLESSYNAFHRHLGMSASDKKK